MNLSRWWCGAGDALEANAPLVWDDCAGNLCADGDVGDQPSTDAAFARAAHVVRLETWIQRVTGVPMEPRTAIGDYDSATGLHTIHAGTGGGVVRERQILATVLNVPERAVPRGVRRHGRKFWHAQQLLSRIRVAALGGAARRTAGEVVRRPHRMFRQRFPWPRPDRDRAELALDADGNFLGLRGTNLSNVGAYTAQFVPLRKGLEHHVGRLSHSGGAFPRLRRDDTHDADDSRIAAPADQRLIYVIERLVDLAAEQCGFDRVALRRRNLIPPDAMPYTNGVGITYDNGEYENGMDAALALADWQGFAARKAESRARGMLRGIGFANYIEATGGFPRERAEVTIAPEGRVELVLGTMNSGQGHETSFAQLLTEWLGVPFDSVDFVAHDTDRVVAGGGSHSARSMRIASLAIGTASDAIIEKGRAIAAHLLEVERHRRRIRARRVCREGNRSPRRHLRGGEGCDHAQRPAG